MSNSIESAFNFALKFNSRSMTISRGGLADESIVCALASNVKVEDGLDATIVYAREYVIPLKNIPTTFGGKILRGDTLIDPEMGYFNVAEVREMVALGKIIGFRVRTA